MNANEAANPFSFETIELFVSELKGAWFELNNSHQGKSFFIIGKAENLRQLKNFSSNLNSTPAEQIEKSLSLDITQWFGEREKFLREKGLIDFAATEKTVKLTPRIPSREEENYGAFAGIKAGATFPSNQASRKGLMGAVETEDLSEIPARIGFGGNGIFPPPYVHSGLYKFWQNKYYLDLVAISASAATQTASLEFMVSKAVGSEEEAFETARLHALYSPELMKIKNGLKGIAESLLHSPYWEFHWKFESEI